MDNAEVYEILRTLASPLVAITTRSGNKLNGMIANSAVRASLVPGKQRVANYVFKSHLTHSMLADTGHYLLHVLSREQWDEIWALGFQSGRETDKLDGLAFRLAGQAKLPMLTRCYAWLECRVVNVMDAGASTFFMGDVLRAGRGTGTEPMDSPYFRARMPAEWREPYAANLARAQAASEAWSPPLDDRPWRALHASGGRSP